MAAEAQGPAQRSAGARETAAPAEHAPKARLPLPLSAAGRAAAPPAEPAASLVDPAHLSPVLRHFYALLEGGSREGQAAASALRTSIGGGHGDDAVEAAMRRALLQVMREQPGSTALMRGLLRGGGGGPERAGGRSDDGHGAGRDAGSGGESDGDDRSHGSGADGRSMGMAGSSAASRGDRGSAAQSTAGSRRFKPTHKPRGFEKALRHAQRVLAVREAQRQREAYVAPRSIPLTAPVCYPYGAAPADHSTMGVAGRFGAGAGSYASAASTAASPGLGASATSPLKQQQLPRAPPAVPPSVGSGSAIKRGRQLRAERHATEEAQETERSVARSASRGSAASPATASAFGRSSQPARGGEPAAGEDSLAASGAARSDTPPNSGALERQRSASASSRGRLSASALSPAYAASTAASSARKVRRGAGLESSRVSLGGDASVAGDADAASSFGPSASTAASFAGRSLPCKAGAAAGGGGGSTTRGDQERVIDRLSVGLASDGRLHGHAPSIQHMLAASVPAGMEPAAPAFPARYRALSPRVGELQPHRQHASGLEVFAGAGPGAGTLADPYASTALRGTPHGSSSFASHDLRAMEETAGSLRSGGHASRAMLAAAAPVQPASPGTPASTGTFVAASEASPVPQPKAGRGAAQPAPGIDAAAVGPRLTASDLSTSFSTGRPLALGHPRQASRPVDEATPSGGLAAQEAGRHAGGPQPAQQQAEQQLQQTAPRASRPAAAQPMSPQFAAAFASALRSGQSIHVALQTAQTTAAQEAVAAAAAAAALQRAREEARAPGVTSQASPPPADGSQHPQAATAAAAEPASPSPANPLQELLRTAQQIQSTLPLAFSRSLHAPPDASDSGAASAAVPDAQPSGAAAVPTPAMEGSAVSAASPEAKGAPPRVGPHSPAHAQEHPLKRLMSRMVSRPDVLGQEAAASAEAETHSTPASAEASQYAAQHEEEEALRKPASTPGTPAASQPAPEHRLQAEESQQPRSASRSPSRGRPLRMNINFALAPGVATLIPVYEGDTPEAVARAFLHRHGIAGTPQAVAIEPLIAHLVSRSMASAPPSPATPASGAAFARASTESAAAITS